MPASEAAVNIHCTSSDPASRIEWLKAAAPPKYVTIEVACDYLRACCLSVHSANIGLSSCAAQRIGLPRHRQVLADQNILCARGLPLAYVSHVPNTAAVKTF